MKTRAGGNPSTKRVNASKQNSPHRSKAKMSIECCPNHPWVLLKANLLPPVPCHGFVMAQSWDVTSAVTSAGFQRQKRDSTLPEIQVPRGVGQVSHTHPQTIATAGQHLLLAISSSLQQREKHRNPLHTPGFSRVCFFLIWLLSFQITRSWTSSLAVCSVCASLCLHCCELFGNIWAAAPLSTPLGLCKGGRDDAEPLVIHFWTGELIDLATKFALCCEFWISPYHSFKLLKRLLSTLLLKHSFCSQKRRNLS